MSARRRVVVTVAVVAAVAAALTVGAVALQTNDPPPTTERPDGAPPLVLDLGVRDDAEARELRRAERLVARDRRAAAAAVFGRYRSLQARIGAAVAAWPDGTVRDLQRLAREHPGSGLVRLNLGFALFWDGRRDAAVAQWRAVKRVDPDSLAAIRADDLLHPNFARGVPHFVSGVEAPAEIQRLRGAQQVARLRALARTSVAGKLLYGIALQRLGKQLSARRTYDLAAAQDPTNVEARVAAAVARFDKARPEVAFSRLGPLSARFPRNPSVRFHLGLLLLWTGRVEQAERQLALVDPASPLGMEARTLLERLEKIGRK